MCFKKKKIINSKFHDGDMVSFYFRKELDFGYIYKIKEDKDGNVIYDIQLGGQCPSIIYNIKEEDLRIKK